MYISHTHKYYTDIHTYIHIYIYIYIYIYISPCDLWHESCKAIICARLFIAQVPPVNSASSGRCVSSSQQPSQLVTLPSTRPVYIYIYVYTYTCINKAPSSHPNWSRYRPPGLYT